MFGPLTKERAEPPVTEKVADGRAPKPRRGPLHAVIVAMRESVGGTQRAHGLNRSQRAEVPVEVSAVRNGIDMRAEEDRPLRSLAACVRW